MFYIMEREIIATKHFAKDIDGLIKKRHIGQDDFDDFKKELAEDPHKGDLLVGSGGVRKIRLKSFSRGKSGGFRVCYYYLALKERIYLLLIFAKNEQENLKLDEKKILKDLVNKLKEVNNG